MRRKIKKSTKPINFSKQSLKTLDCDCGRTENVDIDCVSVVCSICVQQKIPAPVINQPYVKKVSTKPKGWHWLKEFVDKDGTVYHKGKEIPELKGTKEPTNSEKIKSSQKEKREDKKVIQEKKLLQRHGKKRLLRLIDKNLILGNKKQVKKLKKKLREKEY